MGFLYKLDFDSGKSYIGITTSASLKTRIRNHKHDAMVRNRGYAVNRAWRKYGEPSVVILAIAANELLVEMEKHAIATYNTISPEGYNLTTGGDITTLSQETRAKISAAKKGRVHSDGTRARMSAAHKGHTKSPEWRARIAASHVGMRLSQESRDKISAANSGRKRSDEVRARMSLQRRGSKRSQVTRERQSAAKLHAPRSVDGRFLPLVPTHNTP